MGNHRDIADVLVIGAGASGGAFTWSLTQAGVKVVCLEQGGWVPQNAFPVREPQAQLHWQSDFHPNPNLCGQITIHHPSTVIPAPQPSFRHLNRHSGASRNLGLPGSITVMADDDARFRLAPE